MSLSRLCFGGLVVSLSLVFVGCGDDESTGGSPSSGGTSSGGTGPVGGMSVGGAGTGGAAGGSSGGSATGGSATGGSGGGGAVPLAGFGDIDGACGVLEMMDFTEPYPQILDNELDFGMMMFSYDELSTGGQAIYDAGNLNVGSLMSEIFAYEMLYRCELATFLKGEDEIAYDVDGKKTDILVEIDGLKVGVSVVRAQSFPKGDPFPVATAQPLIEDKLADILESSVNVSPADAWEKQILHVIAQTPEHRDSVVTAWNMIAPQLKYDTIVVVSVTEGDDDFIYYNN